MNELTFNQKIEHLIYGLELIVGENYKTTERPYYFQLENVENKYSNNVVNVKSKEEAIKIANKIAENKAILIENILNPKAKLYLRVIVGTP